jgi:Leucine-rich repeat (LRR) protein
VLDVGRNRISSVPEVVYRLTALKRLDLSHNPLSTLASSVRALRFLESLNVDGTAFLRLPQEILALPCLTRVRD